MYNGFQHDLKAVCDLAHAHGAYVYADIIQGVGAVPLDVRATGVDFAATASFKWLMGDFGLGFLFVREELLGRVIRRKHWSYGSSPDTEVHLSPLDPRIHTPVTWTPGGDATSYFQLGTMANGVADLADRHVRAAGGRGAQKEIGGGANCRNRCALAHAHRSLDLQRPARC